MEKSSHRNDVVDTSKASAMLVWRSDKVMRRSAYLLGCLIIGIFVGEPWGALAADRVVTILGSHSCADWLKDRKEEEQPDAKPYTGIGILSSEAWLGGFLTGLNVNDDSDQDILGAVDMDTVIVWTDRYCAQNPSRSLKDAGQGLYMELKKLSRRNAKVRK